MGNCMQHPPIHEESFRTSHRSARNLSKFSNGKHHSEEEDVYAPRTEENSSRGSAKKSISFNESNEDGQVSSDEELVELHRPLDQDAVESSGKASPSLPSSSSLPDADASPQEKQAHRYAEAEDKAIAPTTMTTDPESTEETKPILLEKSMSKLTFIVRSLIALAAAVGVGFIVVTRFYLTGEGESLPLPVPASTPLSVVMELPMDVPLPIKTENVDSNVSPGDSFWDEIQRREDERLSYPRKVIDQHVRSIINESESLVVTSPSSTMSCDWSTQWESDSNDLTASVYCNSHGIVQEWTTSIKNRTMSHLD
eukprot:scaffold6124_cov122-Cylindrotheca_fusiformis.AAC.27